MTAQIEDRAAEPLEASKPERPDVLISYSRRDQAFVERLAAALEARGFDVWVDWEDIRKSADWRTTIERGIESAKAIVSVLSPDFAGSDVCRYETERAAELNKRFVPILRRDVDERGLADDLTRPNWIGFRESESFETALEELVDALTSDNDWLDRHARLLVRAGEWERAGRDRSLLLRGSDLREAESWLTTQGSHREKATPLQGAYIAASRSASRRRQQIVVGSVVVAFGVTIVLAVLAWLSRNEAIEQSNLSRSRELASASLAELEVDPELSLLLALEAADAAETPEAERALREALGTSRVRLRLQHGGPVNFAVWSSDGERIATASEDGTAGVWNASTGRRLATLEHSQGGVNHVSFGPSGDAIFTSGADGEFSGGALHLWRGDGRHVSRWSHRAFGGAATMSGGRLLTAGFISDAIVWRRQGVTWRSTAVLARPRSTSDTVTASSDGRYIATTESGYSSDLATNVAVHVWTAAGEHVRALEGHASMGRSAEFSPNSRFLVTTGLDHAARVWSVETGKQVAALGGHQNFAETAAFSPRGGLVATGSTDGSARVWDARTWRMLAVLRGHGAPIASVAFSPDGRRLLTASGDGSARVWDVTGLRTAPFARKIDTYVGDILRDGSRAVATRFRRSSALDVWNPTRRSRVGTVEHAGEVSAAELSPDGRLLVSVSIEAKEAIVSDARTGARVASFSGIEAAGAPTFSADGRLLALPSEASVLLWDTRKRTERVLEAPEDELFWCVALSPDGTLAATGETGGFRIWDTATGRQLVAKSFGSSLWFVTECAFSPDGTLLVTASEGRGLNVWDARTAKEVATLSGHTGIPLDLEFSRDGRLLLSLATELTPRIWDPRAGRAVAVLRGHSDDPTGGAFSADGRYVVTASADTGARVWEAETGRLVAILKHPSRRIFTVRFRGSSTDVVAIGPDGAPSVHACELCAPLPTLRDLALKRSTRKLTPTERVRYLHEDPRESS